MVRGILPLLTLIVMLLSSCGKDHKGDTANKADTDTLSVMVMQIRKCARLYTAECKVRKIVTHDDEIKLKGSFLGRDIDMDVPFSSRKIAVPIDATLKAYIDFSNFSKQNVEIKDGRIEILLPDPKVEMTSSSIDHEEIKRQVALLRSGFTDKELTDYEKQGRTAILNNMYATDILEMARESAAHILVPIIADLGYKDSDVTVTFRKKFSAADMPMLIENNDIENETTTKQQ